MWKHVATLSLQILCESTTIIKGKVDIKILQCLRKARDSRCVVSSNELWGNCHLSHIQTEWEWLLSWQPEDASGVVLFCRQ